MPSATRCARATKAALIEWITNGTFDGVGIGTFVGDASGVARPDRT
jgi:hypothetical protein